MVSRTYFILIVLYFSINTCFSSNSFPIILVNGFMGWGKKDLVSYKYWGGTTIDIERYLKKKGFKVYSVTVGPLSSNHDRACELFFQLKGGTVDYGQKHAEEFKHKRFGRKYKGLLPHWNEKSPIHLIGHSMGGQTIRLLSQLLEQDQWEHKTNSTWIKSITTISTPHNGTTSVDAILKLVNKLVSYPQDNLNYVGGSVNSVTINRIIKSIMWKRLFDFRLDQWNLKPGLIETLPNYLYRILKKFRETKDNAFYDVSLEGAEELNKLVKTYPNIYYLSYATQKYSNYNKSSSFINPLFWFSSRLMNKFTPQNKNNKLNKLDWKNNDGMVNTISMRAPSGSSMVNFDGNLFPGRWNYMGTFHKDHGQIIGHGENPLSEKSKIWIKNFYITIAKHLYSLN